jgi:hypothetical protein
MRDEASQMEWVAPGDPWPDPLADWAYFRGFAGVCVA